MSKWLRYYRIDICSPVKGTHRHQYEWAPDLGQSYDTGLQMGHWENGFEGILHMGLFWTSQKWPTKAVHRGSKQNPGEHQSRSWEIIWVQNPILNQIALCILVKTWTRTLEKGRRENSSIIALLLVQKSILMKTWVWINNNDTVVRILSISGSCSLIRENQQNV